MRLVSSIPNIAKGDWNSVVNFAIAVQKNINKLSGSKLGTDSIPSFSSIYLTGMTAGRLISTDSTKTVVSTDLNSWVTGTSNQVNVTNDGDGTITLALDGNISSLSALTPSDSNIIVGNGTTWVAESGATARTSLGLGTTDSPTFNSLNINTASGLNSPMFYCPDASVNYYVTFRSQRSVTLTLDSYREDLSGSCVVVRHARGTVSSPAILKVTDEIGGFFARAYDGVGAWRNSAGFEFTVSNTPDAGKSPPSSIRFYVSNGTTTSWQSAGCFLHNGNFGAGTLTPSEKIHSTGKVRADSVFNCNGTDGVTQAASAGTVCDVTALAGGIATAQTQVTYAADGTYNFDATSGKVSSITITNGRITSITTA